MSWRGARIRVPGDPRGAVGEHTAGLLQIVSATEHAAVGVVIYACDELMPGDWLAPFTPEPIRAAEPAGTPAYDRRRAHSLRPTADRSSARRDG